MTISFHNSSVGRILSQGRIRQGYCDCGFVARKRVGQVYDVVFRVLCPQPISDAGFAFIRVLVAAFDDSAELYAALVTPDKGQPQRVERALPISDVGFQRMEDSLERCEPFLKLPYAPPMGSDALYSTVQCVGSGNCSSDDGQDSGSSTQRIHLTVFLFSRGTCWTRRASDAQGQLYDYQCSVFRHLAGTSHSGTWRLDSHVHRRKAEMSPLDRHAAGFKKRRAAPAPACNRRALSAHLAKNKNRAVLPHVTPRALTGNDRVKYKGMAGPAMYGAQRHRNYAHKISKPQHHRTPALNGEGVDTDQRRAWQSITPSWQCP